ncbi:MAG: acetyl-CoA C-acetyltransferase, partial [Desulfobacteraceae bacterium]
TPIGNFGGSLHNTPVAQLGARVLKAVLKKAGIRPVADDHQKQISPDTLKDQGIVDIEREAFDYDGDFQPVTIDEVIMGNVIGAGQGQNVARQAAIRAGIPKETPAYAVNKVCGSGMKAVALAAQSILLGENDVVLCGGMESMSLIPYAAPSVRWGARMGNAELVDLMALDGLLEIFYGYHMGLTAENIAERYGISRPAQDELGAMSHQRARAAISKGWFEDEIVPVVIPQRRGDPIVFDTDERPMETSVEKMSRLKPVFKKDGTVTAGNAAGINDGAAALLLMSEAKAAALEIKPLARIRGWASAALDPAYMGLAPVPAVRKILKARNLTIGDFGVIELNEAFAVQAIACMRELNCKPDNTNLLGSGISLGHPIGCTGARILVTLLHLMRRQGSDLGLATLCIGGGQGTAMALENAA